ncbi:MAG: S8 family serine peptidase [Bdellovibrionales bacterium]|nr:S8 family serine peptidase [Bdellovibrionales bacterium]
MAYFSARILIFLLLFLPASGKGETPRDLVFHSSFDGSKLKTFSGILFEEGLLIAQSICNMRELPQAYAAVSRNEEDSAGITESVYENTTKQLLVSIGTLSSDSDPWIEMQDLTSQNLKSAKFYLNKKNCQVSNLETKIGGEYTKDLDNSFRISSFPQSDPSATSKVIVAVVDEGTFYIDHPIFEKKWHRDNDGNLASPSSPFSYSHENTFLPAHPNWVIDIVLSETKGVFALPIKLFKPRVVGFSVPDEPIYASQGGRQFLDLLKRKQYNDIDYARKNGSSIVNMSFGSYEGFQGFRAANGNIISWRKTNPPGFFDGYKQAMSTMKELVFVVSAGNEGVNLDDEKTRWLKQPRDNVIVVGATDKNGRIWKASNTGQIVDFAALGVEVEAIAPRVQDDLGVYKYAEGVKALINGTSFAAPYVSRVIAKILQIRPDLAGKPKQIKEFLCANVVKDPSLTQTTRCGGYISEDKILSLLSQQSR